MNSAVVHMYPVGTRVVYQATLPTFMSQPSKNGLHSTIKSHSVNFDHEDMPYYEVKFDDTRYDSGCFEANIRPLGGDNE